MSNYPFSQDNNITLPGVSGSTQEDVAISALREATFAVERELGIKPSGIYADVRARLDILEARINSSIPPGVSNDGYIKSPLILWNTVNNATLTISDGYGYPTENRLNGSLFLRADGYENNEVYIRRSNGWFPIQTDCWSASRDLAGTYTEQYVIGIRGRDINSSVALVGPAQEGFHLTWNNSGACWEAQTGFVANADLAPLTGPFGRTGQTVIRLQNRKLSAAAPGGVTASDGDALAWDPIALEWQPRVRAVIFDGYVGRTNLRANRGPTQSPIDTTKKGIVNFGNRSTGSTTGTTADYSAILSGDKNTASGTFSLVVAGESHQASALYASVLNGLMNAASAQSAFVINGSNNTASQTQAFVLDGYSNNAAAINSFVLNGGNNQANASYSGVLGGLTNIVNSGATHAGIGWGSSNTISAAALYGLILGGNNNQLSAPNAFAGNASNANVQSTYSAVHSGLNNTIGTTSGFSTVLSGNTNAISNNSGFGLIGNGNNITVTGLYATVLNANTANANGLNTLILNGNNQNVTGTYSTIINGLGNTISGNISYGTILDGYSNTVSAGGGWIGDGYNNSITSTAIWSTVINGNGNSVAARNSTVLNGASNTIDAGSSEITVLTGTANTFTSTTNSLVSGNGNIFTSANNSYILGQFNNIQSPSSKIIGSSNSIGSGGSFNRIFGNSNSLGANSTQNTIFGPSNILINSTHDNTIAGSNNIVDGYGNSNVFGFTNIANSNFGTIIGQYGKARMFGQQVHANSRFTAGTIGQAQWSRLVLTGSANNGAAIQLLLQDNTPTPVTLVDGYSYDMQIRVMVVNTSPIGPNPVVPARFIFDVLAHQESGSIVIDHINQTVITPNTSDDPNGITRTIGWSVTISSSGNQLQIIVDPELSSANYVQPGNTPSNRRAIATIEMREMTRL